MGMKVTCRTSRGCKASHNDRQFDVSKAAHIDAARSKDNHRMSWLPNDETEGKTFEEMELEFYEKHYSAALEAQNERHRARRQYKRIRTMQDVITSKTTMPDETILQIGNVNNNKDVTPDGFTSCAGAYIKALRAWSKAHGNHVHLLTGAVHLDEASPHMHLRVVYDYVDKDGVLQIGQEAALEASGLELPDPSKPVGRKNNRKMAFTAMCRGMWQDICEAHGYEIDRSVDDTRQMPHLGGSAWRLLQDELREAEEAREAAEAARTASEAAREDYKAAAARSQWAEETAKNATEAALMAKAALEFAKKKQEDCAARLAAYAAKQGHVKASKSILKDSSGASAVAKSAEDIAERVGFGQMSWEQPAIEEREEDGPPL